MHRLYSDIVFIFFHMCVALCVFLLPDLWLIILLLMFGCCYDAVVCALLAMAFRVVVGG